MNPVARPPLIPVAVESVGRPVVASGIARLLLTRWHAQQSRPKPALVFGNAQSRSHLLPVLERHL